MKTKEFRSLVSGLEASLGCHHMLGGSPASRYNQVLITQGYRAWLSLAEDVLVRADASRHSIFNRLDRFCQALRKLDTLDVLEFCSTMADKLICQRFSAYDQFKADLTEASSLPISDIGNLLAPILPTLGSFFNREVGMIPEFLPSCLSFLRFLKKLTFEGLDLEEKAIRQYKEIEDQLRCLQFDEDLLKSLNQILREWLRDLDFRDFVPLHGNGSVAEGALSTYQKYVELYDDDFVRFILGRQWSSYYPLGSKGTLDRTSRTVFVPKTFSKLRTISMEPATLQYLQQGVMAVLYEYIENHPYLGVRIKLRDQSQNQYLAKLGSIEDSFSTIDLSAASDSVSWLLVKRLFAGTPLLRWLYATRSKRTLLPTGEVLTLAKFAPMGSALCFPVECLIFAACTELSVRQQCIQPKKRSTFWSVYGDDIVVDCSYTDYLIQLLTKLGFSVNLEKSFISGHFRESCGKDYFDGVDVSSVYYRLPAYSRKLSPEVYSSLCSSANLAGDREFPRLRAHYLSVLTQAGTLPYFTSEGGKSPYIKSPQPTNFKSKKRWRRDWQYWCGRFTSVISKPKRIPARDEELVALHLKLSLMAREKKIHPRLVHLADDKGSVKMTLHGVHTRLGYVDLEVLDPVK